MNYPTIFHLISAVTNKAGASCILIGGFAVNYYKVSRHTADVDFLTTEEDFGKIKNLLKNEGFKIDSLEKTFARMASDKYSLMNIDYLFIDEETFDKIAKDSKVMTIAGQKFIVPSVEILIALKLHAIKYNKKMREHKDLPDIINLIRLNKADYKSAKFRSLCLKYGTEELYNKIIQGV